MNKKKNSKINIMAIENGTASRVWRFNGYAERINRNSPHEMYVAHHSQWSNDTLGAEMVIFEMMSNPNAMIVAKRQGAVVVYESDDAMVDAYGKERKELMHLNEERKQSTIDTVNECDAVIVTNRYLKENFEKFTKKPIYVFPNYIDFEWYGTGDWDVKRNTNEVRIGWFGSRGHFEDLRMVLPAIKRVLEKYPHVKFVYCGYGGMSSEKKLTEIGWGEDVFKEIPRHRREFHVGVSPEMWVHKHRALDLDIGICPLIDDYFNHCKTNIKWQEYSALGTPVVASPTVYGEHPIDPEASTISHGKDGFIATTEDEWVEYLSKLVEDKDLRKKMGKAAKLKLKKKWDLDKHVGEYISMIEEISKLK